MKKLTALACVIALLFCIGCTSACAEGDSWTCPECGAENTTNFCIKCGTKRPETIVCPDCGEKYPADTEAAFCGNCGAKLRQDVIPSARLEGNGFDTPEEAVTYYLEGLKNLNFNQMLRAFAWETQAEHFSVDAKIRRLQAYMMNLKPRLLGDSDFIRTANLYSLRTAQIDAIYQSIELYILQADHPMQASTGAIVLREDSEFDAFKEKFNNGRLEKLAGMANIRFLTPDEMTEGKFSLERNQENYIKMNAMYGADETVDVPAVADLDGEILFCCPTVARYGDKWYLVSVSSMTNMIMGIATNRQAFAAGEGSLDDLLK